MLGPGAEKLKDRLQRVCEKIDEFAKDRTHNLDSDSQLLSAAQLHLKSLQKAPQLSDTLFQEFCSWLIKIGWQNIPATKREISAIRECLQLAYNSIEILIRSNIHIPVIDEKTLLERRNIVTASIKSLTILNEQIKVASVSIAKSNRKQATLRTQLVSLDALFPYAKAEYTRKTEKRLELRKHIDVTIERLSSFEDEDIDIGLGDVLSSPIGTSAIAAVNLLAKQEKKLTEARRAFKAMKNSQSSINVLRQNLLITAQELLRKVPNPDQCPICHTDFAAGELKNRMLSAIIDDSERKLRDLQLKVTSAEQELAQKRQRSTILNRLLAFVGKKDDITVDKAIEMVIQERQTLKLELKNLKDLDKYFQVLADTGLDERKLSEHLKILGLNQLLNVSEISKIKAEMIDQVDKEVKGEKSSKNLIEKIRADVEKCASDFGIPIDATPEEVIKQLHSQLSVLDMIIKAISELSTLVDMKGKKFNELAIQIEQAQSQFQKLATAIARERVDISNVEVEKEKIENLENRIKKVGKERNRLLEAKKLFNELTEQLTGDDLVSQILTENASLISLIFTVIHMPNEFKIKVEQGKFFILRRETGEKVKLTEMSSGQRAAYALSLFLAMNARLVGGPRVLLFDDPIAHVDDMNVLSFIDHLRNVAVKGSRQIFFATADNKVAGLFRQKFRFLGDKDFCDIELSRDEYH